MSIAASEVARERAEPSPGRRGPQGWLARQDSRELIVWGVLIAAALAVRFIGLGNRPFHHDESQDAYFSFLDTFHYNPLLHGPLRFYETALSYTLFGDSNFTARLAPALNGLAMVALCFGLRPVLGRGAAFAAAALLAFGPSYLYFSRFAREDIYVAAITLGLLVVILRFLEVPRRWHPAAAGALLALSFATKETTFITVFVLGSFFLVALALPRTRAQVTGPVRTLGWEAWGWGIAAFAGVFTLAFTVFLTWPQGLWDGIYTGLKYWLDQHGVRRGGEPDGFYLVLLFGEEWPALLFGAIGAVALWRRKPLIAAFLLWDFGLSLAVYSWAGEKFAWLVLHPLLPLLLLSGAGLQAIWQARSRAWRGLGLAAAAVALSYAGVSSWWVNVDHGANPRELLVSTQSSTQVKAISERVVALAAARRPGALTVTVDSAEGATFPYAWYFRHLSTGYIDLSLANAAPPTSDVVILTEGSRARLGDALQGYTGRRYDFRVWWVRDYSKVWSPGNWWRWMTRRQVWNPTGGMPEWIYTRNRS